MRKPGRPVVTDDDHPRLLRTSTVRWWQPIAGLGLVTVVLVACGIALLTAAGIVSALFSSGGSGGSGGSIGSGGSTGSSSSSTDALALDTPLGLLANNLVIACLIPAAALAVATVQRARPGLLASVTGRLRWPLLGRLAVVALVVVSVFVGVGFLLPGEATTGGDTGPAGTAGPAGTSPGFGTVLALLAVILVSTPLQSAGEEVGFRGYLTQVVSSWFARPAVGTVLGVLASATVFALAHGAQQPVLFADRFLFGLVASWLAWRTGGLEASIALHAVNNMASLGISAVTGTLAASLASTSLPWSSALLDAVMIVTYAVAADRVVRRHGLSTRRQRDGLLSPTQGVGYPGPRPSTSPPAGDETPWGMG